ncbi:hypothetical protein [Methanobacterium sp. MBAC-LM]|uniref:hypothetical protein n=1 Tax=Methanobacterium sp. MBAC-LM TaxID=3412034 RepID=UPI003C726616
MRLNKLNIIGIIMILFAALLAVTSFLDNTILTITYHLMEGSSKGKSLILFAVMGSILLFYPLFQSKGLIGKRISSLSPSLKIDAQKYLKFTIITIFFTYIVGLLIEVWIRIKLGVSLFTMFVSYNGNEFSTTALTHSHAFKSVLGYVIHSMGIHISSTINTGVPLAQYTVPFSLIILITFPLIYIAGIIALSEKRDLYKVLLAFFLTLSFITMLDGGMLDYPAWIALAGLLIIYYVSKKPFSPRDLYKPALIMALIIILRVSISVFGSNTDFHELTIIDPVDNINLNGYDVLSIQKEGNKTIVELPGDLSDKPLLLKLIPDLKGQCSGFALSWNYKAWI